MIFACWYEGKSGYITLDSRMAVRIRTAFRMLSLSALSGLVSAELA
jgi:hypothetical protein